MIREDVDFDGVEIDFEGSLEWSVEDFENYIEFLAELKGEFEKFDLEVIVDMPAIDNQMNLQVDHPYKYSRIAQLGLDGYVLMMYDYMYGKIDPVGISPEDWVERVVNFAMDEFGEEKTKLIGGIHSYAYRTEASKVVRDLEYLRFVDIQKNLKYLEAVRDSSGELSFVDQGKRYYFADSIYLQKRKDFLEELGLQQVNVWQIIGNPWFE